MKLIPVLIALLFFSCLSTEQIQNVTPTNGSSEDISEETPKVDEKLESQWAQITLLNVEKYCFDEAKEYALDKGFPSWTVSSCDCEEKVTSNIKDYECTISAADGTHSTEVVCFKNTGYCNIVTETGVVSYTFDQLEQLR